MTCKKCDQACTKMQQVTKTCLNFLNLGNQDKFTYLLTAFSEVARSVVRFIDENLPLGQAMVALP